MQTGELTEAVKKRSVYRPLQLDAMKAYRRGEGDQQELVCSTAGPLPGYLKMPWRQMTAAANGVAVSGGVPLTVSLQGLIPTTYEETCLREDMKCFAAEARLNEWRMTFAGQDNPLKAPAQNEPLDPQTGGLENQKVRMPQNDPQSGGPEIRKPRIFQNDLQSSGPELQKVRIPRNDPQTGGLEIREVQIQVSDQVSCPQYFVTCMGSTSLKRPPRFLQPGQELVLTRQIALTGTAALARSHEEELQEHFPAWLVEQAKSFDRWMSVMDTVEIVSRFGACPMHRLAQGGIFNALWEMAETARVGLDINLREIPVRQETVEICEFCDINPYYLYSEGALLIGTNEAAQLVDALRDAGIPAAVIGRVTDKNDRMIHNGENCRYLDRPKQDELWKFS